MKKQFLISILTICSLHAWAQHDSSKQQKKERLDFAQTYFEIGGTFFPSFTGKGIHDNEAITINNSASVSQYLNWGGFHFWGHAEIYVTIPMNQFTFNKNDETDFKLIHSVATGARFLPWAYKEKKIRPYVGAGWSALDFKQIVHPNDDQPMMAKDLSVAFDAGLLYGYKNFSVRLGAYYFPDNKWQYPISKTEKAVIKTPGFALQLGLLYTMDFSKRTSKENIDKFNSYPRVSKQSFGSKKFGAFFIGVGPSSSFSLAKSVYNQHELPYLKDQLTSNSYFDVATGYHFYKAGMFTALSFRNPKFETEGYGSEQYIRKTSLLLEVNKFITDYTGFAPYVGLNVAYDRLKYYENIDGTNRKLYFTNIEPGITLGWDIQPGKNVDAFILRTNLRWFPLSSFEVDGQQFDFSQLEYNLIQIVFYPDRLKKKSK